MTVRHHRGKNSSFAGSRFILRRELPCTWPDRFKKPEYNRVQYIRRKEAFPRKDHSSRISGDLCIAGEHCTAVCRPCSTGSSGDCHRSSDLFHGSYRCISNCRRYRAHRLRHDIDRKISGSSLHDGRQWISDGRCRNPRWSTYHIYM